MNERKLVPIIAGVVGVILVGILIWFFLPRDKAHINASGTIEATEVEISSKVAGTVLKVAVSEGDKIEKGGIIARLDDSELAAVYKQAKANAVLTANNLKRMEELSSKGFASSQALDQARASFDAAKANEDLTYIRLRDATIFSPISGFIIVKSIEEGEFVSPGASIVTIADITHVHIMVYVSEREVGRIKLGDTVSIAVDSYPNERFGGKVTYIAERAEFTPKTIQTKEERVTQVFAVKVEVENFDLKLKPGLPADALIKI